MPISTEGSGMISVLKHDTIYIVAVISGVFPRREGRANTGEGPSPVCTNQTHQRPVRLAVAQTGGTCNILHTLFNCTTH